MSYVLSFLFSRVQSPTPSVFSLSSSLWPSFGPFLCLHLSCISCVDTSLISGEETGMIMFPSLPVMSLWISLGSDSPWLLQCCTTDLCSTCCCPPGLPGHFQQSCSPATQSLTCTRLFGYSIPGVGFGAYLCWTSCWFYLPFLPACPGLSGRGFSLVKCSTYQPVWCQQTW